MTSQAIRVDGKSFALNGKNVSYRFHVDDDGELITDHFGGMSTESVFPSHHVNGWVSKLGRERREYPDLGRGDFRIPAIRIRYDSGCTISRLQFQSATVVDGKPDLPGLPSTFGDAEEVSTLLVHLHDTISGLAADLSYSIFPAYDVITRHVKLTNKGNKDLTIERAASFSVDLPYEDLDMVALRGDWAREARRTRKRVDYGTQSFGSTQGYSSHGHNPYVAIVAPSTTDSQGEAWAFNLVYTGSHSVDVEKGTQGLTRTMLGFNSLHLSYPLAPGESLITPECVATYSNSGIGGTSRLFHRLYRNHLMRGRTALAERPVLLNSWEGLYFDFDDKSLYKMANESADMGIKLFVLDDGWFGNKHPRVNDRAGLGDWVPNSKRFPDGFAAFGDTVTQITVKGSSDKLRFGLWVEPEMVNPESDLYKAHPDWILFAGDYPRTEVRQQLVLNLALPEVQDFIISSVAQLLSTAPISYVKWDNNRGVHELPDSATAHRHMLGLYRVLSTLTTRFPTVLWEGCASGGGRIDAGVLPYFPINWTSDNTDGLDRIFIQFGTSIVYPPASMSGHVSKVPNEQSHRITPFNFRVHVALMCGSFGFELNPAEMQEEERHQIPRFVALAEKVNPIVVNGDQYRLALPDDSNWPAVMYVSEDGSRAVLFYYQIRGCLNHWHPAIRLQGLDAAARYTVDGKRYSGGTLMNSGLRYTMIGDYQSKLVFIDRE